MVILTPLTYGCEKHKTPTQTLKNKEKNKEKNKIAKSYTAKEKNKYYHDLYIEKRRKQITQIQRKMYRQIQNEKLRENRGTQEK